MNLIIVPVLLFLAYLVFVTVTVLLARLFFTKIDTENPERGILKQARIKTKMRRSVVNGL